MLKANGVLYVPRTMDGKPRIRVGEILGPRKEVEDREIQARIHETAQNIPDLGMAESLFQKAKEGRVPEQVKECLKGIWPWPENMFTIPGDNHVYFFEKGFPVEVPEVLREEDAIEIEISGARIRFTKPLYRIDLDTKKVEVYSPRDGEWKPAGKTPPSKFFEYYDFLKSCAGCSEPEQLERLVRYWVAGQYNMF